MLDVSDVFSYPTVVEMAEYIDGKLAAKNEAAQKENTQNVNELLDQLESGEIEVEKMLEYFDE